MWANFCCICKQTYQSRELGILCSAFMQLWYLKGKKKT